MSNRIKAGATIKTRAEFEAVIDDIVTRQMTKERLEWRRDKQILAIRETFDGDIADVAAAERYADEHREDLLPAKLKTAETSFAKFGFRTGNPTLVLLNRKWTWKAVVAALKLWANGRQFIVVSEAPDKDAMKLQLTADQLAFVGTRIEQKETFFIEPKRDPADPQRLVSEAKAAA
jgi:hypothetical protein